MRVESDVTIQQQFPDKRYCADLCAELHGQ